MSETSTIFFFSKILTATFWAVLSCMASLTLPKVPCPRVFSISMKKYLLGTLQFSWADFPKRSSNIINNKQKPTSF